MTDLFCRHCGASLIPESKFCSSCGQPAQSAPTTMQQTDYVDVSPQQPAQHDYQQQVYYQDEYQQPQPATEQSSVLGQQVSPPAVAAPLSTSPTPQQAPVGVYLADRKNPGVAAVLSFFWAGLGQIYNGQLAKGIGFIVLYAFCVLLIFVLIGIILVPIVWIIGIWDAYNTAKQYNERQLQNERLYYDSHR